MRCILPCCICYNVKVADSSTLVMNPSDMMATSAALAIVATHATPTGPLGAAAFRDATQTAVASIASNAVLTTFVAGAVAGGVSRTLTAPLDRLKMLAQEGRVVSGCPKQSDLQRMKCLTRHVYAHDGGLRAFWRGNGINCLKAGPEYAVAFSARQAFADRLCQDPSCPRACENFLLGALSGLTAQSILYPLEITKTRMAVATRDEYNGVVDCVRQSFRRGGLKDLYRGLGANLAGVVPHRSLEMGAFFSLEAACRNYMQLKDGDRLPVVFLTATGFVASVTSQVLTYPLNLARTKLQTQGVNGRPVEFAGLHDCLSSVVRMHGLRGLFVGLLPNMLKAAPASTIMYTVFRSTKDCIEQRNHRTAL